MVSSGLVEIQKFAIIAVTIPNLYETSVSRLVIYSYLGHIFTYFSDAKKGIIKYIKWLHILCIITRDKWFVTQQGK
jgi:hypothetical protein